MADAAWRVRVRGLVQGVGFRPFVWRLAHGLDLRGRVGNDGEGVLIHAEGAGEALASFASRLLTEAPAGARVDSVDHRPVESEWPGGFAIITSPAGGATSARVPPDRAACEECRREVFEASDRRHGHPFATCTACGPRYSIIETMPYDRTRTTMAGFAMCRVCAAEYAAPADRRFHAQPIACPECGPGVEGDGIAEAAAALEEGRVIALKGLGGYQLLVRADGAGPVSRLRRLKHRPTKPFAVMVRTLADAEGLAVLSEAEKALLASPENPIVLVRPRDASTLCDEIAPGLSRVGLMLPTTPLHHLLLARVDFPVVATSGNLSDEPIAVEAGLLTAVSDVELTHDRPIARRVDDSLAHVVAGVPRVLRLARGYAPLSLPALERSGAPPTLAVGGQQKSALALWTGSQAVLGAHVGELDALATREAFEAMTRDLPALYGCRPEVIACDLHPDYASTRWAEASGLPMVRVQHHHAHAAACMAEHGLTGEALAFTWDGTGFGPDGTVWGGEVLLARHDRFERVARLRPFVLPGGEAAVREPARVALALLTQALGVAETFNDPDVPRLLGVPEGAVAPLLRIIEVGVSCPVTSSMGRLFDGGAVIAMGATPPPDPLSASGRGGLAVEHASSVLEQWGTPRHEHAGSVLYEKATRFGEEVGGWGCTYEGEPAARLEACVIDACCPYALPLTGRDEGDWRQMIRQAWHDRKAGVPASTIAWRFHEAVIAWAADVAARHAGLPVVLGGGCFANGRLLSGLLGRLSHREAYGPALIPPGDGGLAAGQLAVALSR